MENLTETIIERLEQNGIYKKRTENQSRQTVQNRNLSTQYQYTSSNR